MQLVLAVLKRKNGEEKYKKKIVHILQENSAAKGR